jgi:hypothetical protein
VSHRDEPQNMMGELCDLLDEIDEWKPMCGEARGIFRNQIVPLAEQLLESLIENGRLEDGRVLVEMFERVRYFVQVNGPASFSDVPNDGLLQRRDLNEDEQRWRP